MKGTKDDNLYAIDIKEGRDFEPNPANVGAKKDFNRIELPNTRPDALENSLSKFEDHVAKVLRWMEKNKKFPANDEDYGALMLFISILATRNPIIRDKFAGAQTEVFKRLAEMMVANPKVWNNQLEK